LINFIVAVSGSTAAVFSELISCVQCSVNRNMLKKTTNTS